MYHKMIIKLALIEVIFKKNISLFIFLKVSNIFLKVSNYISKINIFPVHFCWWSQVECHAADAT